MVDQCTNDGRDSGDQVGEDLVDLKELDDSIPVAIKDTEKRCDDALETLTDGLRLVRRVGQFNKHSHTSHRLVLADVSVAVGI